MLPNSVRLFLRAPGGRFVGAALAVAVSYTAWILRGSYNPALEEVISSLLLISFSLLFAGFALILFRKHQFEGFKRSFLLLAFAGLCNAIGESIWFYYESILHMDAFLSIADAFFLLFYPTVLAAVLLFPFAPAERQDRILLRLDLGIVMTVSFMVCWYFILASGSISMEEGPMAFIAISYPAAALLILVALVALVRRNVEKMTSGTLFFMGLGMICNAVADIAFAYYEVNELSYTMPYLNMLWLWALFFFLLAPAWQGAWIGAVEKNIRLRAPRRLLLQALPYLAGLGGLALLVVAAVESSTFSDPRFLGVLISTLVLAVLVVLRQYFAL